MCLNVLAGAVPATWVLLVLEWVGGTQMLWTWGQPRWYSQPVATLIW